MAAYGRALMHGDAAGSPSPRRGFQPGNTASKGRGRPKGSKDKIPRAAKQNIEQVFEELGGVDGMVKWATESPRNLAAFYCQIYPKILPLKVDADVRYEHLYVQNMSMSQLEDALHQTLGELGMELASGLVEGQPANPQGTKIIGS